MSGLVAHYIVHTDASTCKRKPVLGRWKNETITSHCSSKPEQSPVFSKAMINQRKTNKQKKGKPTVFSNDWETQEKIYVVVNVFLEIIILRFMQKSFPSFQVTCLLFPSSITVTANAFLSFCHLASRIKTLNRSSASPITIAVILTQKFYPGFSLRRMAQACLCSLFYKENKLPCASVCLFSISSVTQ